MATANDTGMHESVTLRIAATDELVVVPSKALEILIQVRNLSPEDRDAFDQLLASKVSAS